MFGGVSLFRQVEAGHVLVAGQEAVDRFLDEHNVVLERHQGLLEGQDPSQDLVRGAGHRLLQQHVEDGLDHVEVSVELADDGVQRVVQHQHLKRDSLWRLEQILFYYLSISRIRRLKVDY